MLYSSQPKLGLGRSLPIFIIVTIVMNKIVLFQNWSLSFARIANCNCIHFSLDLIAVISPEANLQDWPKVY
jgi:hypothetical protein